MDNFQSSKNWQSSVFIYVQTYSGPLQEKDIQKFITTLLVSKKVYSLLNHGFDAIWRNPRGIETHI